MADDFLQSMIERAIKKLHSGETDSLNLQKIRLSEIPKAAFDCVCARKLLLQSDVVINEQTVKLSEEYWWEVSFDNNTISTIPDEIGRLQNLEILDISQNLVHSVSGEIGKLGHLRELHLRNNLLSTIPAEIGQLEQLQVLDLSFNRLEYLPETIGNLRNLRVLNLFANNLRYLPASIGKLRNLEELRLGNFDKNKVDSDTIERFSLKTNYFEILPVEIASLPKLKILEAMRALSPEIEEILSWGLSAYPFCVADDPHLKYLLKKANKAQKR